MTQKRNQPKYQMGMDQISESNELKRRNIALARCLIYQHQEKSMEIQTAYWVMVRVQDGTLRCEQINERFNTGTRSRVVARKTERERVAFQKWETQRSLGEESS